MNTPEPPTQPTEKTVTQAIPPAPAVAAAHTGITGTALLRDLIDDELARMTGPQLQHVLAALRQINLRAAA